VQIGCAFSGVADSQSVGHFYNSKNIGTSLDVCNHMAVKRELSDPNSQQLIKEHPNTVETVRIEWR
jgi:hypothetical protein